MAKNLRLEPAISRGLAYLAQEQDSDGGFTSFSSPSLADFSKAKSYQTTFVPALMLNCLVGIDSNLCKSLAQFLLKQRSPQWSFNYWAKGSPERQTLPYPDDLDDTFCALIGLARHDPSLISPEVLAKVVKLLLATESQIGGPYRTWLVAADSEAAWLDLDLAVNANIAYFLDLIDQSLPNLEIFMDQAIKAGTLGSPYYPSTYPLLYYLARSYRGPEIAKLIKTAKYLALEASNSLETALSLTALTNLKVSDYTEGLRTSLLSAQQKDGSWPARAFCIDPAVDGRAYYHGASALTTAFALEALNLCAQPKNQSTSGQTKVYRESKVEAKQLQKLVLAKAKDSNRSIDSGLRSALFNALSQLAQTATGAEIINLPHLFSQSLRVPLRKDFSDLTLNLAAANLYGWLAYTVYDDFLDDEGQPQLLSLANVAMRRSLQAFEQAVPHDLTFQRLVRQTFDIIDGANAWEIAHCRFEVQDKALIIKQLPDYGNLSKLAERSLGHSLTPLAILVTKGLSPDSIDFQKTLKAFKHYLIARQLNDDAHDWETDLQNGHITYVVRSLLQEAQIKPGRHDLLSLHTKLQKQFWRSNLVSICREIQRHIRLSRQDLKAVDSLQSSNIITQLLDGLEHSVNEALATQAEAVSFLKHYRGSIKGAKI